MEVSLSEWIGIYLGMTLLSAAAWIESGPAAGLATAGVCLIVAGIVRDVAK
jgi:hypothetical protein